MIYEAAVLCTPTGGCAACDAIRRPGGQFRECTSISRVNGCARQPGPLAELQHSAAHPSIAEVWEDIQADLKAGGSPANRRRPSRPPRMPAI